MRPISYRLVDDNNMVTSGAHATVKDFADWRRNNNPGLVEVAVWEGELADRPDHVLDRLRNPDAPRRVGDSRAVVLAGAVA